MVSLNVAEDGGGMSHFNVKKSTRVFTVLVLLLFGTECSRKGECLDICFTHQLPMYWICNCLLSDGSIEH